MAKANIQSAEIKLVSAKNDLIYKVKSTYFSLAFYHSRLSLLKQQDRIFSAFQQSAKLRFEKGETSLLEKMLAESQSFEIKNLLNKTVADIQIFQQKLKSLLHENQVIDIKDTIPSTLTFPLISDSLRVINNSNLAYLQQQVEISNLQTKVERSKFFPEFSVGYFNQTNKELSVNQHFTGLQAGASIPILFFAQKGILKSATINREIAKSNLEYAQNQVESDLKILIQEYLKNKNSLEFYTTTAVPQADLLMQQAQKSYKAGINGYLEFVQILKQTIEIKNSYLEILNANNQSIIEIEWMIGKFEK